MMNFTDAKAKTVIQECFQDLLKVEGALAIGLGEWRTGQCLAYDGFNNPAFPNAKIETAIFGNSEVIKAKMKVASDLGFSDEVDGVWISLTTQWHVMRLLSVKGYFLYIALDRSKANIASASLKLMQANRKISPVLPQ